MQLGLHMVTIEELVPRKHFLRRLEGVLDLSFVYEETAHLYSRRYGRSPIDPVVLVKYLLVGTDSTHVKANASRASEEQVELTEEPGVYWERLDTL